MALLNTFQHHLSFIINDPYYIGSVSADFVHHLHTLLGNDNCELTYLEWRTECVHPHEDRMIQEWIKRTVNKHPKLVHVSFIDMSVAPTALATAATTASPPSSGITASLSQSLFPPLGDTMIASQESSVAAFTKS